MTKADKEGQREAPILRFKGFTDAWEQRKLENLLKVNSGKDYKQLGEGNIPVYGTSGYMLSVNKSLSENDAIGIGRKGTIDKPQFLKAPFWTVDTLFFLTLRHTNDLSFIYYKFQNINWKKYDESTGVPSLTKNTINKIKINIPKLNEQSKIRQLFTFLDNLLALYERKLQLNLKLYAELLKQFIPDKNSKSILNKINWQSVSLGKIAHLQKGKQKNRNGISEVRNDKETYPVYNGGKEKSGYTDEYNRNDSIIISEGGNSAGYVNYIAGKFYSGGHNYSIEPQNIDSSLLYLILLRNQSRIMNLRTGSGLPNIKISSLKSFKIFIPSKNDNLYDFDKLLILFTKDNNLIKDKLNKLKLIKKTLLNTMFI